MEDPTGNDKFGKSLAKILAGVIIGGCGAYFAENRESAEFMQHINQDLKTLEAKADPHSKKWDELHGTIQVYRYRADSLKLKLTQTENEFKSFRQAVSADSLEREKAAKKVQKQIAKLEDEVEDLRADLGKKYKGRYSMRDEAALLYACIFDSQKGKVIKIDTATYFQLAECCIKALREVQEEHPSISDFKRLESSIKLTPEDNCMVRPDQRRQGKW